MRSFAFAGAALAAILALAPSARAEESWFVERAAELGVDFVHFNGMSGRLYYLEVVGSGGALFDYDGDGDLDLYLVQGAMLGADRTLDDALLPWTGERPPRDRLYRNDLVVGPDGSRRLRFTDVTEASGIDSTGYGMGAAAADHDGDGDVDLYVLDFGVNRLWRNRGDGTFEEVAEAAGVDDERWSVSASFADFDGDGDLDLYVVDYLDYSLVAHKTCLTERGEPDYCLPAAYRPIADRLYRNRGDGTFEEVSEEMGIAAAPANGLGVVSGDFDGDGRLDFYVANDLMANQLWLNRGDRFVDEGLLSGAALNREGRAEASMGVDAADFDADGDLDLFLTHFRRESNTALRAEGPGIFVDATEELALAAPSWDYTSFGTGFFDYDNDGWLDLLVVSGAVTYPPGADRSGGGFPFDERNQLFRNLGGRRFEEVSEHAGPAFALSEVSRGALFGDLDDDGDTDVVVTNNSGPARILINQLGSRASWLGVRTLLDRPRRDALGAIVTLVRADGPPLVRRVRTDGGYASSHDPRVVFGLGTGDAVEELRVRWPDGRIERFAPLPLGRYHTLVQGTGTEVTP